jgi:hypothetical protein
MAEARRASGRGCAFADHLAEPKFEHALALVHWPTLSHATTPHDYIAFCYYWATLHLQSPTPSRSDNDGVILFSPTLKRLCRSKLVAPFCLVAIIALFYWPLLAGIYTIFDIGPDLTVMAVPDLNLRAQALRAGIIPVWDPYEMGGQSPLGEATPAVLDPFSYPLLLMPLRNGHLPLGYIQTYYVLLHCLAGLSAYFLLGTLSLRCQLPGVVGGVFYALAGVPGNAIWFQVVTEAIYAPLVLLFVIRSLRGIRPLGNSAIAGLLLGFSWFSGTHHVPLMMSIICGALLLTFAFLGDFRRGLSCLVVFGAVMTLISAPQVIPALQWARESMRWVLLDQPIPGLSKVPYLAHLIVDIHPSSLLAVLIPAQGNWQPFLFMGNVALVFAVVGFRSGAPDRWRRVCLFLIIAGILLCISSHNVLYGMMYLLVPAFDKLRESFFWIFPAHLGATCLIGLGVNALLREDQKLCSRTLAKVLAIGGAALMILSFFGSYSGTEGMLGKYDMSAITGVIALLLGLVFYSSSCDWIRPATVTVFALGLLLIEQGNVAGHLSTPRGHGNPSRFEQPLLESQSVADFLRKRPDLQRIDVNQKDLPMNFGDYHLIEEMSSHGGTMLTSVFKMRFWTPRMRQLYGVNYYLARKPSQPDQVELFTSRSGIKVFANPGARPRTWSVHKVLSVPNYERAVDLLSNPAFDMVNTSFVQGQPPPTESCAGPDKIDLIKRTWFSVAIHANMSCTGLLILNDNWYPGWKATLDGKHVAIYAAYMTVRGIVVGPGSHVVEMHYRPRALELGLALFFVGLAITVWLCTGKETAGVDLLRFENHQ